MRSLRSFAYEALARVGDSSLGEWQEWTGYAFHLRRRLSALEQADVGEVLDIRGTPEAARRLRRVAKWAALSPQGRAVFEEELLGVGGLGATGLYLG